MYLTFKESLQYITEIFIDSKWKESFIDLSSQA